MSDYLVGRIQASDRITLHIQTEITALKGDKHLEEVTWCNSGTGTTETHAIRHVFLMIGAVPNTQWLQNCLTLDEQGFVCTGVEFHAFCNWFRAFCNPKKEVKRLARRAFEATSTVSEGSSTVNAANFW